MGRIRRWFQRFKLWLTIQGLPHSDPALHKWLIRRAECQILDADQMMRRRHGRPD